MKEGDIISINGVTYVAIKTYVGDGFLYFDSKALHYYCGQLTNIDNYNKYTDLILVANYPKWKDKDFYCITDEDISNHLNNCTHSITEKIIETQYGKMNEISSEIFGTILMDAETYKYHIGSKFTIVFAGGTVKTVINLTNDIEEHTIPYNLIGPYEYYGYRDIEKDFIVQESSIEETNDKEDFINTLLEVDTPE